MTSKVAIDVDVKSSEAIGPSMTRALARYQFAPSHDYGCTAGEANTPVFVAHVSVLAVA